TANTHIYTLSLHDALPISWVMAGLEVNGVEVPEKKLAGTTLVIKGDKYTVKVKDTSHETTIKIDPTTDPKAIDMLFPNGTELPRSEEHTSELQSRSDLVCR